MSGFEDAERAREEARCRRVVQATLGVEVGGLPIYRIHEGRVFFACIVPLGRDGRVGDEVGVGGVEIPGPARLVPYLDETGSDEAEAVVRRRHHLHGGVSFARPASIWSGVRHKAFPLEGIHPDPLAVFACHVLGAFTRLEGPGVSPDAPCAWLGRDDVVRRDDGYRPQRPEGAIRTLPDSLGRDMPRIDPGDPDHALAWSRLGQVSWLLSQSWAWDGEAFLTRQPAPRLVVEAGDRGKVGMALRQYNPKPGSATIVSVAFPPERVDDARALVEVLTAAQPDGTRPGGTPTWRMLAPSGQDHASLERSIVEQSRVFKQLAAAAAKAGDPNAATMAAFHLATEAVTAVADLAGPYATLAAALAPTDPRARHDAPDDATSRGRRRIHLACAAMAALMAPWMPRDEREPLDLGPVSDVHVAMGSLLAGAGAAYARAWGEVERLLTVAARLAGRLDEAALRAAAGRLAGTVPERFGDAAAAASWAMDWRPAMAAVAAGAIPTRWAPPTEAGGVVAAAAAIAPRPLLTRWSDADGA